ncbi:MAG TPA: MFS transporter, partial [Parafilimonas sp.]|nr:MFS transporter [Parafilimonas sp.]
MNITLSANCRTHRIAVSVFFFVAGITVSSWASRIPDIKEKLQLSEAALGGVLFALPVGQLVSLPLSGWLISRFGSRQLVTAAAILSPLTPNLLGCATAIWQLIAVLF